MPFFVKAKPGGARGKKRPIKKGSKSKVFRKNSNKTAEIKDGENEEVTSDEDDYIDRNPDDVEDQAEDLETPQEKKIRLAKKYIQELEDQNALAQEDRDIDRDAIGDRLYEDVLDATGELEKFMASSIAQPATDDFLFLKSKHQKLSITCAVVSSDDKYIFSASKDCSIVKYSINGDRLGAIPGGRKGTEKTHIGHTTQIYSLALSTDGMFLVSGDQEGKIYVWNAKTLERIKIMKKHRDAISGLSFRRGTHTLYSASHDRMTMVWDVDTLEFVEHLGGHQDKVTAIDSLYRESCITSGGRDQSVLVYDINEDKQLRFDGHRDSIDGVKLLNVKTFITFGQDGTIAMWITSKKRPVCEVHNAHGTQDNGQPYWITAVATMVNTDLMASGSMDGFIRLWKIDLERFKRITRVCAIPLAGIVNSLAFTSSGSHLIVGLGQEHKLGRWYKEKNCKNAVVVIPLDKK